jgi:beta-xylosidase
MIKPTPNPPENEATSPYESLDSNKLHEAAERALDHHFPSTEKKPPKRNGQLFSVCPDINTEALLANASEDLLSISAIAADLADDVDGSSRSVALALSRMADGVHLLVEQALDHLDEPEMAAILAKQQSRVC